MCSNCNEIWQAEQIEHAKYEKNFFGTGDIINSGKFGSDI